MSEPTVQLARFSDLSAAQLYRLLRLRVDVFVVEQDCAYPELDGRDTDAETEHLWLEVDGEVAATIRILVGAGCRQIGRVATARAHRGRGYAAQLVRAGLDRVGAVPVRIGAQAHLQQWYEQFGFARSGPDYLEDGIAHLPMLREP